MIIKQQAQIKSYYRNNKNKLIYLKMKLNEKETEK